MVLCWKNFSLSKFWGVSVLWKKSIFSIFSLPHLKKIQTILIRPILNFDALPIAHFETYVPLFLKHLWKLAISLKLWVPAHFEVGWSRTVAAKIGVFRPLFWRKSFFWPISTQWTPPSVIHGWKATNLLFMTVSHTFLYRMADKDWKDLIKVRINICQNKTIFFGWIRTTGWMRHTWMKYVLWKRWRLQRTKKPLNNIFVSQCYF